MPDKLKVSKKGKSRLHDYITQSLDDAKAHRRNLGIDERVHQAMAEADGKYYCVDNIITQDGIVVKSDIAGVKVQGFVALFNEILREKNWQLYPTREPSLPEHMESQVVRSLKQELIDRAMELTQQVTGVVPQSLTDPTFVQAIFGILDSQRPDFINLAGDLKELSRGIIAGEVKDSLTRMEAKIEDQLQDSNYHQEMTSFIRNVGNFPAGVLKGPTLTRGTKFEWVGNVYTKGIDDLYTFKNVHPLNYYPSPDKTRYFQGSYEIELDTHCKSDFLKFKDVPGFISSEIDAMLKEYKDMTWQAFDAGKTSYNQSKGLFESNETIDVVKFYGKVSGSVLKEFGISARDDKDSAIKLEDNEQYEIEAWVIDEFIVMARMNYSPQDQRPFHLARFRDGQDSDSIWGRGIRDILRDEVTRPMDNSLRTLFRNMGYSSGPVFELQANRLAQDVPENVAPLDVIFTKSDPISGTSRAINAMQFPSLAGDMIAIFDRFTRHADEISNIPAFALGSDGNVEGLGLVALSLSRQSKILRMIAEDIDNYVIEPIILEIYIRNMMFSDDPTIKADAQVVVQGHKGILQKEITEAKAGELLAVLPQFAGILSPEAIGKVFASYVPQFGFTGDDLLNENFRKGALDQVLAGRNLPQQTVQPTSDLDPTVTLDGRSTP